jgi:predicted secreted acid phosphatase
VSRTLRRAGTIAACAILLAIQGCASVPASGTACPALPPTRVPVAATPLNIDLVKRQLTDYHDNKRYEADLTAVFAVAELFVDGRLDRVAKPAIVLDIDETSLSNWETFKANDFGLFVNASTCNIPSNEACGFNAWIEKAMAPPIEPARAFFNTMKSKGVAMYFVTGRRDHQRPATERNLLRNDAFVGWTALITRPDGDRDPSVQPFKTRARERIQADGYTIVANIGDQLSDLDGGRAAECAFKLPNPYYFID